MPRDKTEAHEKIITAAVKEFMEYGFENASMRSIASEVGLTVGALYRHFPNKEEMFAALVEPTIDELMKKYREFCEQGYEVMKCGDVQQLWNESESETKWLMCFVYDHFEAFKLLICRSQGTRFESFVHDMALLHEALQHDRQRAITAGISYAGDGECLGTVRGGHPRFQPRRSHSLCPDAGCFLFCGLEKNTRHLMPIFFDTRLATSNQKEEF